MSCLLCRGLFSCDLTVFVHDNDAWVQRCCSVGRMMCAQLPLDSQVWPSLANAELSTTEAFAASMSCLLCCGLFSCGPAVFVHDNDAWVQRRCLYGAYDVCAAAAGFADVAVAGNCRIKHDRGICRVHELFALPRLVFVRPCGACTR